LEAISQTELEKLLEFLNKNPSLKIEIQGHICCQTSPGVYDVSPSRARAVWLFLIKNGINKNRMSFKGFGTTRPIHPIPEKSAQEEEDNRRVEIMILSK
jgi:outer membrane protein OmpA-like peptidoglycan-associated protein